MMNAYLLALCALLVLSCVHISDADAGRTSPVFSAATACNAPPSSATAQADLSGRLWGWIDGTSCAFKDASGAATGAAIPCRVAAFSTCNKQPCDLPRTCAGRPLFYKGYTPNSAAAPDMVTTCQDPASSLSTAVKDSAGTLWGWEQDQLCRLEQADSLPTPATSATPAPATSMSNGADTHGNNSSGWLTPASAASPDAIIQPAAAAEPLPPSVQPPTACQQAARNASLELSEADIDRLADAVANRLSTVLSNGSRAPSVLDELNSTGYGWSLLQQELTANATTANSSDTLPALSPAPEAPSSPGVSTDDILKETFGSPSKANTSNSSGAMDAQAASDNDSRRLMLAQPAPGGMTLPSPIGHGRATIPLVYVDPSAPMEQTNGGFKVAEQDRAAIPTVYRQPVLYKAITGTPWLFGPAGITSPSGRFLGSPNRLSGLPYDTQQGFSIASETVGAYVDQALTNAQQLSGFQPLGHRNF